MVHARVVHVRVVHARVVHVRLVHARVVHVRMGSFVVRACVNSRRPSGGMINCARRSPVVDRQRSG